MVGRDCSGCTMARWSIRCGCCVRVRAAPAMSTPWRRSLGRCGIGALYRPTSRALRPAGRLARAGNRGRLSWRRRHGARHASHGRPQLVVPLFADQWENGVAVNDAGCGIVLGPTDRGMEALEQALVTLLTGSSHRDAAIRVAGEVAAMPTANDLAHEIEVLAARSPSGSARGHHAPADPRSVVRGGHWRADLRDSGAEVR